jgi:hypothetical protein
MTTTIDAKHIFGRWMAWQRVYQHREIASFAQNINEGYWLNLVSECRKNDSLCKSICDLFEVDQDVVLSVDGHLIQNRQAVIEKLLALIDTNMPAFLAYLKDHHFVSDDINQQQLADTIDNVINHYVLLLHTLFYHEDKFIQSEYLFSVGNRFFDFCFGDNTNDLFYKLLHDEADFPLTRLVQTMLWWFLSAEGWRDWHADSLAFLKREVDLGKTIVYVAGGTDLYQLLRAGVYNIEVIDPLLPSQAPSYYSEGWAWLIQAENSGDEITINDDVLLRRHSHETFDMFQAVTADGETVDITHTHTTWWVCDRHSSQTLGKLVFKRRFAVQSDFVLDPAKTLLTSFNELYLLSAPSNCGGWGIDSYVLLDDMTITIKQLQKPITATKLKRLTRANDVPFRFVNLGGCAT